MLGEPAGQLDVTSRALTSSFRHTVEHIAIQDLKQTKLESQCLL